MLSTATICHDFSFLFFFFLRSPNVTMTLGETAIHLATRAGDERPANLTGLASAPQDEVIENARGLISCQLVELYDIANAACKALDPDTRCSSKIMDNFLEAVFLHWSSANDVPELPAPMEPFEGLLSMHEVRQNKMVPGYGILCSI